MQLHKHLLKSVFGNAALAPAALGGFLFFGGASSAQAREIVVVCRPVVVVRPGFYARPRFYYTPGYVRHEVFVHGWRDRYGCWHRY
jgi:hypothetical protein